MDIPILVYAVIGLGFYAHYLLSKIAFLSDQVESMGDMVRSMARELKELGSPNVYIEEAKET
jgi:hypothetical protein